MEAFFQLNGWTSTGGWSLGAQLWRTLRSAGARSRRRRRGRLCAVGRGCLILGHRSLTQRSIAAWSRSAARRLGRWTVQPSRWSSSAHTQAGWWRTPVRRSITVATRSRVHSSPTNPCAVAPPAGPAQPGRAGSPTASAETPSWRATSARRTPTANKSAARSRRAWSRSRSCYAAGRRGTVGMPQILTCPGRRAPTWPPPPVRPSPTTRNAWLVTMTWLARSRAAAASPGRRYGPSAPPPGRPGRGRC